eukprot:Phypoly_transcript_03458.p1 GENE.Phypoly_transcript_03458~~Phypoly_transcript_03458.p1  ORF type:complete len:809 (+),score=171.03 Phypoly_transcript_03458:210-2429(+)
MADFDASDSEDEGEDIAGELNEDDEEDEDGVSEEEDGEVDDDDITEGIDEEDSDGASGSGEDDDDEDGGDEDEEDSEGEGVYDSEEDEEAYHKATVNYAEGSDSSEDETIVNTVGNIPLHWYDDFDHIGYDREGNKIMRSAKGDSLDNFLKQEDDPNFWRTIHDKLNDKSIVLSDEQLELVHAIQKRKFPAGYDPYPEPMEFPFDSEFNIKTNQPSKAGFLSAKKGIVSWEIKKIYQMAQRIRDGQYVVKKKDEPPKHYDLWAEKPKPVVNEWLPDYLQPKPEYRPKGRVTAPKQKLPGHAESYNPPEEYLFSAEEAKEWSDLGKKHRRQNFQPTKYKRFRDIKQWTGIMRQAYERCLDLYLAPRKRRQIPKREWEYQKYLPELPKPKDLRPFPTTESIQYKGHTMRIRSITMSPSGEYFATGSDDCTVRVWEVSSGRSVAMWTFEAPVLYVAWNPVVPIIAVAVDETVYFVSPELQISNSIPDHVAAILSNEVELRNEADWKVDWSYTTEEYIKKGIYIILKHTLGKNCNHFAWHHKGDYFSTVCSEGISKAVHIHQLSKRNTQAPFKKNIGIINCTAFHPTKPFFYVCTQMTVRVYNLTEQNLVRKLTPSLKWISSIDIHPKGDNLLLSSYDRKVAWMDLDLSVRPYKLLKYHSEASRRAIYHKRFPLFATCSDDTTIHVFHGMVYDDLMKNPLIVPLKVLKGHQADDELGVLDIAWHPEQPWLFSVGADSTIRLWT